MLTNIDHLTHKHDFLGALHDENARRTRWVVAMTAIMMIGEIVAGYVTGSMALLADGFHMATHAGALSIAAGAYAYAKRHALNGDYSFGTGKVGELSGFASALILGVVAIGIGVEAVSRLFQPMKVAFDEAIWVAAIGLAVNIVSAVLLSGGHGHSGEHHDHGHDQSHGHGGKDSNLRSAYAHVVADAFTSVLAIVALLAGRYLGWVWLDPAMGIVGAIVISRWSWNLMRDSAAVLLDRTDKHVAEEVRELVEGPGDAKLVDLHVWRVGPQAHAAIVEVVAAPGIDADTIRVRLTPVHELAHLTIEAKCIA
jgi:cation diffusion facilitator family transporter